MDELINNTAIEQEIIKDIKQIVSSARRYAYSAVNYAQVAQNWLIGKRIVEEEQKGTERADYYGKYIIERISKELTEAFGKGYSQTNIRNFRLFYLNFKYLQIQQTVSAESQELISNISSNLLPWSHYERLMRISNLEERQWYEKEAREQMWSFRTLNRNISTQYYQRLLLSQVKQPVIEEMKNKTAVYQADKLEFIKNPTVLEFLGLPNNSSFVEKELEQAILNNLKDFLVEMGKGFAFAGSQQLIRTDMGDFYIDLVFYNYILKCFVLIDLKTDKLTHQDVGQMDMYIRMFDELRRGKDDNPTIGIVLCSETSEALAKYSILKGNEQLFASKYELVLPSPKELQCEIARQKASIQAQLLNNNKKYE